MRRYLSEAARVGAACAAGILLALSYSFYTQSAVPLVIKTVTAAVSVMAVMRPIYALYVVAALTPIAGVMGASIWHARAPWAETLVFAALAGAAVRRTVRPRAEGIEPWMVPAALLALTAATSMVVQLAAFRAQVGAPFWDVMRQFARSGYFGLDDRMPFVYGAMLILAGVGLAVATAREARTVAELRSLLRMLVAGVAAAAALNLYRLVSRAIADESPWRRAIELLDVRINVHYGDINAAASIFVTALFVAAALAMASRFRALPSGAVILIAIGLWLNGSRTAVAAGAIVAVWLVVGRLRIAVARPASKAVAGALLVLTAAYLYLPNPLSRDGARGALHTRAEMGRISLLMAAGHPAFGVGIGSFHRRSAEYVVASPELRKYYLRENAHNQYLQYLAEIGAVGLGLFVWLLLQVAVLTRDARAAGTLSIERRGAALGLSAFLLTCLAGHPLLIREAVYTFWLLIGVLVAGPAVAIVRSPRLALRIGAVLIVVLIASVPFRVRHEVNAVDLEHVAWGVSQWTPAAQGYRTRTVGRQATFHVPADARGVIVPFRARTDDEATYTIDVWFQGRFANRLITKKREWVRLNLVFPEGWDERFYRVDVHVTGPLPPDSDPAVDAGVEMGRIQPTR